MPPPRKERKDPVTRFLIGIACLAAGAALAQNDDPAARVVRAEVDYVLNADGTHSETRLREVKVLRDTALAALKQVGVTYSTSVQRAEILEAYTLKPDGRRIDAPKDNFQLAVNSGREKGAPAFSDWSTLTVIFPEVAVGDTVVLKQRTVQTEAIFPGQFSAIEFFPRTQPLDRATVRVDAPRSLPLRAVAQGMEEIPAVERGDRILREWKVANPSPAKSKRRNWSVYEVESEPGVILSTFASHREIADAYGERAKPRAAVTPRVQELADRLTRDVSGHREQARALYDWVATEITYAGNCVGAGAVVPRNLDFVLDNKMGDCKDHATLLQALLAAKGIPSVQALVNAGSSYRLPALPVVSMVNHVINYVPEFDLFLDSTSSDTPFGMLPFQDADKPVLLTEGEARLARTPPTAPGANRQVLRTVVWIQPDGAAKGEIDIDQKGLFAVSQRSSFRSLTAEEEERMLKSMYTNEGREGIGRIEKDDPKPLRETYRFKVSFEMPAAVQVPGPGAFTIAPYYATEGYLPALLYSSASQPEEVDIACTNGYSEEQYVYHFPKGMKVMAVPKNLAVSGEKMTYRASYVLKGNTLTVKRVLDDRTQGHVCSPKAIAEYRKAALRALQDLKAQVVYQ